MRYLLLSIALGVSATFTSAQNYLITFTGTGASTTVSSVKVENLSSGISLTINGSDILRLTGTTGINSIENKQSSELKIYPNPMTDNSTVEISSNVAGDALITVHDITGKLVAQNMSYLDIGQQSFRLSGLNSGFYLVSVKGISYQYSGKLLCNGNSEGSVTISHISISSSANEKTGKVEKTDSKGVQTSVDMAYTIGDRLKFTGMSEIYSTVKTDIPSSDKTIEFAFTSCVDGDNNSYPVVQIGTQLWIAENLKTTKLNDGINIPLVTDSTKWEYLNSGACCWNKNDSTNKNVYGALYNWYILYTTKLCPIGWHVPSNEEFTTLINYLGGKTLAGGKLKETGISHWKGSNTNSTNESGFTALPGSDRGWEFGDFGQIGVSGWWWTTNEDGYGFGTCVSMSYISGGIGTGGINKRSGFSVRCIQGAISEKFRPSVQTNSAMTYTNSSATIGGFLASDGQSSITERGIYYGTTIYPQISGIKVQLGNSLGSFSTTLTGLSSNTTYYYRAYAINSVGISYGDSKKFTTTDNIGLFYTSKSISASLGGTIIAPDGSQIEIPPDALQDDDTISIQTISQVLDSITEIKPASKIYRLGPDSSVFNKPVHVTLPYTTSHIPEGESESRLSVFVFNGTEYVLCPGTLDAINKTISFNTIHFSNYIIGTPTGTSIEGPSMGVVNMIVKNGKVYATFRLENLFIDQGIWWADQLPWWQGTTYSLNELMAGLGHFYPTPGWYYNVNLIKDNFLIDGLVVSKSVLCYLNYIYTLGGGYYVQAVQNPGNIHLASYTSGNGYGGGLSTVECATAVSGEGLMIELCDVSELSADTKYYVEASACASAIYTNSEFEYYLGHSFYKKFRYGKSQSLKPVETPNLPPTIPTNPSPTNGANNISTNIRLSWASSDPEGDPNLYDVYFGTNENPTSLIATNHPTTNIIPVGLIANTTYYWKIAAKDNWGATTVGPIWNFSTITGTSVPTVLTASVINITAISAKVGGNVTSDGGEPVTDRGIYYGTSINPELTGTKVQIGSGTGQFSSICSGLNPSTNYYVKAYATNRQGTNYGTQVSFITAPVGQTGTITDIEGNIYKTVLIGGQWWMAENLKTTKLNDGSSLQLLTSTGPPLDNAFTPVYLMYDDEINNKNIYGALYTWYTVNTGKICPIGWHVPTDAEWTTLTTFLGGETIAGGKLKETGTTHWDSPNEGATNETGFSALPGGYSSLLSVGYYCINNMGVWWTSSQDDTSPGWAWWREMVVNNSTLNRESYYMSSGISVRCIKD